MVTRAKSLLIIVGNHEALETDENWAEIIRFCIQNGSLVREGRKLHGRVEAPE